MGQGTGLQYIRLHAQAPDKPVLGQPCNGCGVCCSAEPCPVGRWLFGQPEGACPALQWQAQTAHYGCGVLLNPRRYLRWLPAWAEPVARRWLARRIAAGKGCDSDAELLD